MPQTINTNLQSLNAQRHLTTSRSSLSTSMERLSSGLRVNNAADDAAGMAIASRMDSQIRGISVAIRNSNDAISLAQTAEGATATAIDVLQRMRELAVQSANGTNGTTDRANLDTEFLALDGEIARIATSTRFNGAAIVSTGISNTFQVGANPGDTLTVATTAIASTGGSVSSLAAANSAITTIDAAIVTLTTARATYGASINRLGFAISNLAISGENQSAAKGRIMDADFAMETANLSRAQILQQAGNAMVAQANQLPQQVMALLRN